MHHQAREIVKKLQKTKMKEKWKLRSKASVVDSAFILKTSAKL